MEQLKKEKTKTISFHVDMEVWETINKYCQNTGLKKAFLIKKIIKDFFQQQGE